MSNCAAPGCFKAGINRCSICLREPYCSGECQKGDWKSHKLICKTLKKLSLELQPYKEVARVIEEIDEERPKKIQLDVRVLGHLISFAEYQFGDRAPGKTYRERGDGDRMDNWVVEIYLISIYNDLISVHSSDDTLSDKDSANLSFPYYEKILDLLRPWSSCLDSNSTCRENCLDKDQIDLVVRLSSTTECNIGVIFKQRSEFVLAESHCQKALSHARLYEGKEENKTDLLCEALKAICDLQAGQSNYANALPFAEEAYNLVAIVYNPVHPKVQDAAGNLIECLFFKGDLYDAERFATATLDSLKDLANGFDQESEAVALGYYNLANVINKQEGDFVKAEMLVRESLRIRTRLYGNGNDHSRVGLSCNLLAQILLHQGNLGNETTELFERSHAIITRHDGPNGTNTASSNFNLGIFYRHLATAQRNTQREMEYFLLSKSKYIESVRILTKIYGPDHPETLIASSQLSNILRELSEA